MTGQSSLPPPRPLGFYHYSSGTNRKLVREEVEEENSEIMREAKHTKQKKRNIKFQLTVN